MRGKFFIKIKYLIAILALILAGTIPRTMPVEAVSCPDVRIVFARGSGGERWKDTNYLTYKSAIEDKLANTRLSYEFIDLDYPAVGVGIDKIDVTLGALIGTGDAYEFGESVMAGVRNLSKMINSNSCPETKYVIGGYSQGAMVVSKSLSSLRADKIIYAATFGDPKIYLPEGKGLIPAACKGENLSDYRMYVPDCRAYKGLLGAYMPYEPAALAGKVGTWCNKRDVFCSSYLNVTDHVGYIDAGLYEDASRVIFAKICAEFGITNSFASPHDTVFLIDSTGSMEGMIIEYRNEMIRLAKRTLESGGRVALYDYRDYQEEYLPRQRCSFETCNLANFEAGLDGIIADGGGDAPESLLASSFAVMQELKWKLGATKSIVALTDTTYHEPDFDIGGTTRLDVVRLSKQIDPVNFYVITTLANVDSYANLTNETDGRVVTTIDEMAKLTDDIMGRYDSLPRVEEDFDEAILPTLEIRDKSIDGNKVTVKFFSTGKKVLVILNGAILGTTTDSVVTLTELDVTQNNVLTLVPLSDDMRGEPVEVDLDDLTTTMIPKAPDTGRI